MYINDIHSLVPSITLSLSKSSIRSWCFHRHHLIYNYSEEEITFTTRPVKNHAKPRPEI